MPVRYKYSSILILLLVFPALAIGARLVYGFELFWLLSLVYLSGEDFKSNKNANLIFILIVIAVALILLTQLIFWGYPHGTSILRVLFNLSPIFFMSKIFKNDSVYPKFELILYYISILALLQFIDGYILKNLIGINKLIGFLYPYSGSLDDAELELSGGANIAVSSYNSATSIADGHSILLGDLLAVFSIVPLVRGKLFLYFLSFLATLITFSRGSWLMFVIGFIAYIFLYRKEIPKKFYIKTFSVVILSFILMFFIQPIYEAFFFRIANTLFAFGLIDLEIGSQFDGRTAIVWPMFFSEFNKNGIMAYLFGYNYIGPTDSGFLVILRDLGLMGFGIYFLFFIWTTYKSKFDNVIILLNIVLITGLFFHPISQGNRLLFGYAILVSARLSQLGYNKTLN
ncbi:MAG: hypothetical protein U1C70_02810 [Sediminibacterium sp.]|uniref:hypothetical protein n=1 Tax=Sediminibacterium sp. TaxID=1917865 RepID=UPI002AB9940B|nr:hypothetical protein [Sediminibacterium sp.]MDZ4070732.1 hypothetical protein [Sediminibacterium sp.]